MGSAMGSITGIRELIEDSDETNYTVNPIAYDRTWHNSFPYWICTVCEQIITRSGTAFTGHAATCLADRNIRYHSEGSPIPFPDNQKIIFVFGPSVRAEHTPYSSVLFDTIYQRHKIVSDDSDSSFYDSEDDPSGP